MQNHNSLVSIGNRVDFPEWQGQRLYMLPFTLSSGLSGEALRFQVTVNQMLAGIKVGSDQECYLMVDEKEVTTGAFHRRPGLHVDGYWHAGIQSHRPPPRHSALPPRYDPAPLPPWHRGDPPRHRGCSSSTVTETLLLASNFSSARALSGQYTRDFVNDWRGGDCSELNVSGLEQILLPANRVCIMDVMTLHESLPVQQAVRRTVVRINVPNINQ